MFNYLKEVLANMPEDWLKLTTHRLDIYEEERAKSQFLHEFETLYKNNISDQAALSNLPTAYDYIRLGHPLSCVLEWAISNQHGLKSERVICFSSKITPILAVLRKNLLASKNTRIIYKDQLPASFDADIIKSVYGYNFDLQQLDAATSGYQGTTVILSKQNNICNFDLSSEADIFINYNDLGSILLVKDNQHEAYISEIQHVRRRETIAMTPADTKIALQRFIDSSEPESEPVNVASNKAKVLDLIKQITESDTQAVVASSGLSMQYAIMMGLIHDAQENHKGKAIRFIVPPNCYGGTNDQARRVAACLDHVQVLDLPVDGEHSMVNSLNRVLDQVAAEDAVPYIIVEIPTNPRVEVPNLIKLQEALSKERKTTKGNKANEPVFILDQTFCPNTHFLGENEILSSIKTIAYVSGSKFPSGGKCTAGYCTSNKKAEPLMSKIDLHLRLCDNEATNLQIDLLAEQMPSMNQRIADAYRNTREFVDFIEKELPEAKINFVSKELAEQGFTPSVFSLDLPTKGANEAEREAHKRALNLKLINAMITEIPSESKFCVSYGQLKGCYWTIPATSTQGTTKEGDKDYIVRVAVSPNLDLAHHKKVFRDFVAGLN
ncbi:cystathionine beta-synthase [bacterium]|nr:cystathionine beta-synthase [bacterium]